MAQDFRPPSRSGSGRIVELCARCRDAEGGRKDKPGGMFFDRNRLSIGTALAMGSMLSFALSSLGPCPCTIAVGLKAGCGRAKRLRAASRWAEIGRAAVMLEQGRRMRGPGVIRSRVVGDLLSLVVFTDRYAILRRSGAR